MKTIEILALVLGITVGALFCWCYTLTKQVNELTRNQNTLVEITIDNQKAITQLRQRK